MNRQEAEALLPWYVAGALSREEMQAVQGFVDSGEISAARLEELRIVGNALAEPGQEVPRYDPQILARVLGRLDDVHQDAPEGDAPLVVVKERRNRRASADGWFVELRERLQWTTIPPLARIIIGAQFALLLALAAALALDGSEEAEPAGFEVVSGAVRGDYTLTFAPGVTEAQLRALLLEERGSIIAGPSAIGLYTIAFDPEVDASAAAARIQASGLVTFLQAAAQP